MSYTTYETLQTKIGLLKSIVEDTEGIFLQFPSWVREDMVKQAIQEVKECEQDYLRYEAFQKVSYK